MISECGVFAVAARPQMDGDALALGEDLDGSAGEACFDLGSGEAVGHAVEVMLDLDVVIDADPANTPFGEDIGLDGQRLELRSVELFKELAAGAAEPADRAILVQTPQQFSDGRVQFSQAVELPIAQSRQYPALDDEDRGLNLCLVARSIGPGRQHDGAVMHRHLGIGAVDPRLVQAGLDDGVLALSGTRRRGTPPIAAKAPVPKRLGPARLGIGEVRGAPMTATKICAWRISPVSRSTITGTVSPA